MNTHGVKLISFHNPVTTQCKLYVCGDISWWTGQAPALILGQSYTKFPQTNTDTAQQFSTSWGCGGVADIGRSGWASSSGVWHSWKEMNRQTHKVTATAVSVKLKFGYTTCTWSADCYQIFSSSKGPNFHMTIKFILHCDKIKCLIGKMWRYWNSSTRYVNN